MQFDMEDGDTIEVRTSLKGPQSQPASALRYSTSRGQKIQTQAICNAFERLQLSVPAAFAGADTCNWRSVLRALSKTETFLKRAHAAQRLALSCKPAKRLQASCTQRQPIGALQKSPRSNADRSFLSSAVLRHQMAIPWGMVACFSSAGRQLTWQSCSRCRNHVKSSTARV